MSKARQRRQYEHHRKRAGERQAALVRAGQDIGDLPPICNPIRRMSCESDLKLFCTSYFPDVFFLPWSVNQHEIIADIEKTVLRGGKAAPAAARGEGKSALCDIAVLWAILYGHRWFVMLISAERSLAEESIQDMRTQLETNDLLLEDFPEVCFPIRALEGIANRCAGQTYQGQRTHIRWKADQIVLPTIPGSKSSGAIIRVAGILGRIRGARFTRPDGIVVRPDFVILDDPQTDASAHSRGQCGKREKVIQKAVLRLAGPGVTIAAVMPCTVIVKDDLADRYLDPTRHPEWHGRRMVMIIEWPTKDAMKLWEEYREVYLRCTTAQESIAPATRFYRERREAMDAGCVVSWPENFEPEEISGIQHAMNLWFQLGDDFFAECQNSPKDEEVTAGAALLEAKALVQRLNRVARGIVPIGAEHVVTYIDVHGNLLFYVVLAADSKLGGAVIDYGAWPDQGTAYFTQDGTSHPMSEFCESKKFEDLIYEALTRLTHKLLDREWSTASGGVMKIERCLIDANWGRSTDTVYKFCRQSPHASILMPCHGIYIGPTNRPWNEYQERPGEILGEHYIIPPPNRKRGIRYCNIDTYYWKTVMAERLSAGMGDPSSITLFGADPRAHQLIADHWTSEYSIRVTARGRDIDVWKERKPKRDNHLWDCFVGCGVAANMLGCSVLGEFPKTKRKTLTSSDLKRRRA